MLKPEESVFADLKNIGFHLLYYMSSSSVLQKSYQFFCGVAIALLCVDSGVSFIQSLDPFLVVLCLLLPSIKHCQGQSCVSDVAKSMGTWVKKLFQWPITRFVFPLMPA